MSNLTIIEKLLCPKCGRKVGHDMSSSYSYYICSGYNPPSDIKCRWTSGLGQEPTKLENEV